MNRTRDLRTWILSTFILAVVNYFLLSTLNGALVAKSFREGWVKSLSENVRLEPASFRFDGIECVYVSVHVLLLTAGAIWLLMPWISRLPFNRHLSICVHAITVVVFVTLSVMIMINLEVRVVLYLLFKGWRGPG